MPNWVENLLTIKGPKASEIADFLHTQTSEGEDCYFDFNKIIPYPEEFAQKDALADEFWARIDALRKQNDITEDERIRQIREIEIEMKQALPKGDGFNSGGYEWCVKNWGTKWNACDSSVTFHSPQEVVIQFLTAWSPPLPVVEALAQKYPDHLFTLKYDEPGMCYRGVFEVGLDKNIRNDVCHEY